LAISKLCDVFSGTYLNLVDNHRSVIDCPKNNSC
jgi:hypothetical protein